MKGKRTLQYLIESFVGASVVVWLAAIAGGVIGCLDYTPHEVDPAAEQIGVATSDEEALARASTIVWNGDRVILGAIRGNVGDIVPVRLRIFTTRTCQIFQVNFEWDPSLVEVVSEQRGALVQQWAFAEANWEQVPGWCAIGAFSSGSGIILGRPDRPVSGDLYVLNFRILAAGSAAFHVTYEEALSGYVIVPPVEAGASSEFRPFAPEL